MFWRIIEYAVVLFVVFLGSKHDASGTVIKFFGFTLYERRRDPALPPSRTTLALEYSKTEVYEVEEDADDDVEDEDERDLWERLEGAGFNVIEEERGLRLPDVGAIKVKENEREACDECEGDTFDLSEVVPFPVDPLMAIAAVGVEKMGCVCEACGYIVLGYSDREPGKRLGTVAPLFAEYLNFFDVLDYFERMRAGDAEKATADVDLAFLEERRGQLEAELNGVRTAIMREKHKKGEGQAYREADHTVVTEPSDPKTTS